MLWWPDRAILGEKSGVTAQPGAFAAMIRRGVRLALGLPSSRPDIEAAGQQSGKAQQGGDMVVLPRHPGQMRVR